MRLFCYVELVLLYDRFLFNKFRIAVRWLLDVHQADYVCVFTITYGDVESRRHMEKSHQE